MPIPYQNLTPAQEKAMDEIVSFSSVYLAIWNEIPGFNCKNIRNVNMHKDFLRSLYLELNKDFAPLKFRLDCDHDNDVLIVRVFGSNTLQIHKFFLCSQVPQNYVVEACRYLARVTKADV